MPCVQGSRAALPCWPAVEQRLLGTLPSARVRGFEAWPFERHIHAYQCPGYVSELFHIILYLM